MQNNVTSRTAASALASLIITLCAVSSTSAALAVPEYSSLPGAHAKIYLDFGGTDYSGTWAGKTPGPVPASDTDGNASTITATQLANIRQLKAPDGSVLKNGRQYSLFEVVKSKKDLAYASMYAYVAFLMWLYEDSMLGGMSDASDPSGFGAYGNNVAA